MRPDLGGIAYIYHRGRRDRAPDRGRQPPVRPALGREPRWQRYLARCAYDFAGGVTYNPTIEKRLYIIKPHGGCIQ